MTIRQIARPRPSSSVGWALPPSDDEQVGLKEFHFRPVLVDESDAITKDTVSSDITGILAQMIDDPSTCPLPYYRAPNTDD